jgi:hypothetical protein
MPERIREASLAMSSPRGFTIGGRLYIRRAGFGGAIDEAAGLINEDFDPRSGQPNFRRARLSHLSCYSLVHEEWGAVQIKAGNSTQVPELARA